MSTMKLTPRALIRQTMNDAEKVLDSANKGNTVISKGDYDRLPSSMKSIVDEFRTAGKSRVKAEDVLGQLRSGLEGALSESLKSGHLVASEVISAQGMVTGSPQTIAALTATPQAPMNAKEAKASVRFALQNADASLRSQLGTQKTLENALNVLKADDPTAQETKTLDTLVKDRARLMRDVVKTEVKGAENAQKRAGDAPASKDATRVALIAAQEVQKAVNPKSSTLKTLRKKEQKLGADASSGRPFFARFLENQNRGSHAPAVQGASVATAAIGPTVGTDVGPQRGPEISHHGVMVQDLKGKGAAYVMRGGVPYEIIADTPAAKKALEGLSGKEVAAIEVDGHLGRLDDPSGNVPRAVIFASDIVATSNQKVQLNGRVVKGEGAESGQLFLETAGRRFEVDAQSKDAQAALKNLPDGGLQATLAGVPTEITGKDGVSKLVFETQIVDVKGPGTIMVTMKAPSDNEDGGADGDQVMVTMKAPSDHEDSGDGSGSIPPLTTAKFPSDAEDNAGGEPGVYVTLKAPSDSEDNGGGLGDLGPEIFVTMKAPSDHEDGGDGWIGVEPIAPGGDGDGGPADGGAGGAGGIGEDGGATAHTRKFPSDAEDGGAGVLEDDGVMAQTRKFPSDAEDGGAGVVEDGGGVMQTRKFPSDAEDGGVNEDGIDPGVTERFPSDNEDIGDGDSIFTTLKAPSDNEDGGTDDPGGVMVTMKAPSDNEDAGGVDDTGGMVVTLKFPSDNEDGGDGTGGLPSVTERFPSDNEDIGGGEDGVDIGDMVTLKFPSDNEDGGGGIDSIATERYPSDAEDGGDGGDPGDGVGDIGGVTTAKYPSDNEDGGDIGDMVTMRYPSDNEDGATIEPNDGGVGVEDIPEDSGNDV